MNIRKCLVSALLVSSMLGNSNIFASSVTLVPSSTMQKSANINTNFKVTFDMTSDLTEPKTPKQNALLVIASYPQSNNTTYVRDVIKDMAQRLLKAGTKNIGFLKFGENTVIEPFRPLTDDYLQSTVSWKDQNGSGSDQYSDIYMSDYNRMIQAQLNGVGYIGNNINIDLGNLFVAGENFVTNDYVNSIKDSPNTEVYFIFDGVTGHDYLNKGSDYGSKINYFDTKTSFPQAYTIETDASTETGNP